MTSIKDLMWAAIPGPGEPERWISTADIQALGVSDAHARRALRLWTAAGFLERRPPATSARGDSPSYRRTSGAPSTTPAITAAGDLDRTPAMSAGEFAVARRRLGLSLSSLGAALGWGGSRPSRSRAMRRFETGERVVDPALAERLQVLLLEAAGRRSASADT